MKELLYKEIFEIINISREEVNNEFGINNHFVDYCDLVSEKISKKLNELGFENELINGFYIHAFEDSEPDCYGHWWIECQDFLIDGTRDQFDNNNFVTSKNDKNYSYEEVFLSKNEYKKNILGKKVKKNKINGS